ncbi:hypothetical protein WJX81_004368 [Elliptochloris bilobata]|uniref:Protein kinase domain-containing protein n=1 Tax=Elliptochloris bilobata TaxID=381761 RepID=A0AAW1SCC9_9CHLO
MQGRVKICHDNCEVDNEGLLYLRVAKHTAVTGWLPFGNKAAEHSLQRCFDALLNRKSAGKHSSKATSLQEGEGEGGSVAAEALLHMFTRPTFNPLVLLSELQGHYAFAAYDAERKQVFAARDPSGKEPLFYSFGEDGGVSFANQPLAAPGLQETWHALLPGHYVCGRNAREVQQFALTPDQLTRKAMCEAAEDDCMSADCLSNTSTPRTAPHLTAFSLREALSNSSNSLRSSTELEVQYALVRSPPDPPCQQQRLKALYALGALDRAADPGVEQVLDLCVAVFGAQTAMLSLMDADRVYMVAARGPFARGGASCPWQWNFCGQSLASAEPEVLVVSDAATDARVARNAMVPDTIRFYAGAPLVTSNGHRVGMLCVADQCPRDTFDADAAAILANMAEMVVREMELAAAAALAHDRQAKRLGRALDALEAPFLFAEADLQAGAWRVLHANSPAAVALGVPALQLPMQLWDAFTALGPNSEEVGPQLAQAAQMAQEFSVEARRSAHPSHGGAAPLLRLTFRPAAVDGLDDDAITLGVPAYVPAASGCSSGAPGRQQPRRFFFVALERAGQPALGERRTRQQAGRWRRRRVPFADLELGVMIGRGAYGKVYRGVFKGERVAVKVCELSAVRFNAAGVPLEVSLTAGLSHPNLLAVRAHTIRLAGRDSGARGGDVQMTKEAPEEGELWLLLDYCNRGCLADACRKGWLRASPTGPVSLGAVLAIAADIASAMAALHGAGVVHGDLSGGNVLLQEAPERGSACGLRALVGDFGLARHLGGAEALQSTTYGTVDHQAPEVLRDGHIAKAGDVWAFGVLLYSALTGRRPFEGCTQMQVIHKVIIEGCRPEFPADAPADLAELGCRCLAVDPAARPTFAQILRKMDALRGSPLIA